MFPGNKRSLIRSHDPQHISHDTRHTSPLLNPHVTGAGILSKPTLPLPPAHTTDTTPPPYTHAWNMKLTSYYSNYKRHSFNYALLFSIHRVTFILMFETHQYSTDFWHLDTLVTTDWFDITHHFKQSHCPRNSTPRTARGEHAKLEYWACKQYSTLNYMHVWACPCHHGNMAST